jgi:indole-3-glycerol phosphate synthase
MNGKRMLDILANILEVKKEEIRVAKTRLPLHDLEKMPRPEPRDFSSQMNKTGLSVIAEVKYKSPSAGIIRSDFDPVRIARIYSAADADAISVLTDSFFFGGHLDFLKAIRQAVQLPLLRKDFIIDPYQIVEARQAGANAVLLIVRILSRNQYREFLDLIHELGMEALVEVHSAGELDMALDAEVRILGINNRNLSTLDVELNTSVELRRLIPDPMITVSESGIQSRDESAILEKEGFDAILVGETLMRSSEPAETIHELKGKA